jgi:hypothetical protein
MSAFRFLQITADALPQWQAQLEALEHTSVYPLGDDAFQLSHGARYFGFFERLALDAHGQLDPARVAYYALVDDDGLACVGCGVRRPAQRGLPERWYVGDLKVRPDRRGAHLPVSLIRRAFIHNYLRCPRGYAVAMNPDDGRTPPALRAFAHFSWLPPAVLSSFQLDLWSGDADAFAVARPLLEAQRGPAHLVSLDGIKMLQLRSTGAALPLWHVRHGDVVDDQVAQAPRARAQHMWCAPRTSALAVQLRAQGLLPSASATVIFHRLDTLNWDDVVDTSEI